MPPLAGWPTTKGSDCHNGLRTEEGAAREFERKGTGADLPTLATLAGWPTAEASDGSGGRVSKEVGGTRPSVAKRAVTLGMIANTATVPPLDGWATPTAHPRTFDPRDVDHGRQLANLAATVPAKGRLNPAFSGWLMGYPLPWLLCGILAARRLRATRSPKGRRRGG